MKKFLLIVNLMVLLGLLTSCFQENLKVSKKSELGQGNIVSQDKIKTMNEEKANSENISKHLTELTKYNNRLWGTENEQDACDYIKNQVDGFGYKTYIQSFTVYKYDAKAHFSQKIKENFFTLNPYDSEPEGIGHNLIADIKLNENNDKVFVLCAHYDTVKNSIGIIDNTSGVVTLLEVARLVSDLDLPFNIRFIFFSAEEHALYGSRYYVSNLDEDELKKIIACFNVDMVGYKDGDNLILATPTLVDEILPIRMNWKKGEDNLLTKEWKRIFPSMNIHVMSSISSDHYSFEKKGISNVFLTQEYFDYEEIIKKDTDIGNISILEIEKTVNLIKTYLKNVKFEKTMN